MKFILLFFFLQGPRTSFFDLHIAVTVFIAIYGLYCLFINERWQLAFGKLALWLTPATSYFLFAGLMNGAVDFTLLSLIIKYWLYLPAAFGLVCLYGQPKFDLRRQSELMRDVIIVSAVNGLFVICFVLLPDVRTFSLLFLETGGKDHWVQLGFRGLDLSMGGGAIGSLYFSMIFLVCARHLHIFSIPLFSMSIALLLLLATVLTGRTGLWLAISGLPLSIYLAVLRSPSGRAVIITPLRDLVLFIFFSLGALSFVQHVDASYWTHLREVVAPWALEGLPLFEEPSFKGRSFFSVIDAMFFLPFETGHALFGSFNSGRSPWLPYVPSDVGYVRIIYGAGFFGVSLLILAHMPMAYWLIRNYGRSLFSFGLGLGLLFLAVTNFKELTLGARGTSQALLLFFVAVLASGRRLRAYENAHRTYFQALPSVAETYRH